MKVQVLPLILISFLSGVTLSACGGMIVKTWIISGKDKELQRKAAGGAILERKALSDADGYRCYSRVDDQAWRTSYGQAVACCQAKN